MQSIYTPLIKGFFITKALSSEIFISSAPLLNTNKWSVCI